MNEEQRLQLRVEELGTRNDAMARCLKLAAFAAKSGVPVLILGETGTGKTLLAQAIHNSSARARGPFISFVASAMSDTLLESQLFGHERGAFTGAQRALRGKFERANTGTLFLDEIADMSPLAQAKILRAVECGEFERLGSERSFHSNARIISATNRSLRGLISAGRFREDLYQRLNGLTLRIPPLRDRREDLPAIIAGEIKMAAVECGKPVTSIHPDAMEKLLAHPWPGNLRELHHTVRTMLLFADGACIAPDDVQFDEDAMMAPYGAEPDAVAPTPRNGFAPDDNQTLAHSVRLHIRRVCETVDGNQRKAAVRLGISRATLRRHLQKVELRSEVPSD
ncbi:MAG: sigma-54 dependent transcriptional regulator [Opitutaceae bacterium]|nr:sigma-54 dependent transcriptional regulator [Opitutaceae bacterium]